MNKCIKLKCSENCQKYNFDFNHENICIECKENFILYKNECVKTECFSKFCGNCCLNLKIGCKSCYECINLEFINGTSLKCHEIFINCEFCFFKLNSDFNCLKCNENYLLIEEKNKCGIVEF